MNREHNRKLEALFDAAIDISSAERAAFLDRECADDVALRRELEQLLAAAPRIAARYRATVAMRAHRDDAGTEVKPAWHDLIGQTNRSPGFPAGTSIDQYELIRRLGGGGMGDVYLARDTRLARRVAIKFMQHADRSLGERFLLEAQATARCSHENIVVIHDVKECCRA
jgi:serine/threonine protein kinase